MNTALRIGRVFFCFCLLFPLALVASPSLSERPASDIDGFVSVSGNSPVDIKISEIETQIDLSFSVEEIERIDNNGAVAFRIENEGIDGNPGYPDLPAVTRFVRVPDRGVIEMEYSINERSVISNANPAVFSREDLEEAAAQPLNGGLYPAEPVQIGTPSIMRGIRVVPVTVYPVQYDALNKTFIHSSGIDVRIAARAGEGVNETPDINRQPSRSFNRMVDELLVNPPQRDNPDENYLPGGCLIVFDEEAPESVWEFVEWKRRAGHPVQVLEINGDELVPNQLRNVIRDIYAETGFEFLTFLGSGEAQRPLLIPMDDGWDGIYDMYYAMLEGDDALPDVALGTINCITQASLTCAIRRAISYQSQPYIEEEDWFTRAGVGVGACSVPNDLSPSYTGKWITEVLTREGFDDISTSFYADNGIDDPSRMIEDLYNENTNFIIVRAHQWGLETDNIDPGPVYPFHFLCSSGTISGENNGAFNWIFRVGTPDDMRGASAGFGHYSSPRTNTANALVGGLTESLFLLNIKEYGWAKNYALTNLLRVMVADGQEQMIYEHGHWRYYGDPGQWRWRGVPRQIDVTYSETTDPNATSFNARARLGDDPVAGAIVCLNQGEDFQVVSQTDRDGAVYLTWEHGAFLDDQPILITVTGENIYPHLGEIAVENDPVQIALTEFAFDDVDNGDGDGIPNPGENGFIDIQLTNHGGERSPDFVSIDLTTTSPWIEIIEGRTEAEGLDPGQRLDINNEFQIEVRAGCPDGEEIQFILSMDVGDQFPTQTAGLKLNAQAARFKFVAAQGVLEPGEQSELGITVLNIGHKESADLNAQLQSIKPFARIRRGDGNFPAMEVGGEASNVGQALSVEVDEDAIPGSPAEFLLILEGNGVVDSVYFEVQVGNPQDSDPLGPDKYGYIALENGDEDIRWNNAPEFEWVEINPDRENPNFEGVEIDFGVEDEEDSTVVVELPFIFRYYSREFEEITICSNGWLAAGDQRTLKNQQNWLMPGFNGAFGMMAVFWDRLHYDQESDGLFYFYDEDAGRFIIEWNAGVEDDGEREDNFFEAILFNPEMHETITGDSPILFQYHTVNNIQDQWEANAHATVGISSPDGLDGLTFTYWNTYHPSCTPLQAWKAILWTTVDFTPAGLIYGVVTRRIDGEPVAGARVETNIDFSTVTRQNGTYRLQGLPAGAIDITVLGEGYEPAVVEGIQVEEGEELEQNFTLNHAWLSANPVIFEDVYASQPVSVEAALSNIGNYPVNVQTAEFAVPDSVDSDSTEWIDPANFTLQGLDFPFELAGAENVEFTIALEAREDIAVGPYTAELIFNNDSPVAEYAVPISIEIISSADRPNNGVPKRFSLFDPYPNPFNASAKIKFGLPKHANAALSIHDLNGRKVKELANSGMSAGFHIVNFDGSELAAGLYLVRLESEHFSATKRLLLIK